MLVSKRKLRTNDANTRRNFKKSFNLQAVTHLDPTKKTLKIICFLVITTILVTGSLFYFRIGGLFTSGFDASGDTITVKNGGDLQGALDSARPGDTILLEAGATFTGNFDLPKKPGSDFITIRSSALDGQLPPYGVRIDPLKYGSLLPKLVSATEFPVITAFDGAHHYRFLAVEFGGTKNGVGNIVKIGTTEETEIEQLPSFIEFDRVFMHSTSPKGQRRGIAANGKFIRIINSHISDIKIVGDESSAIGIWATDGPVEIANNYLEAAGINILFGGGISAMKLVPTDCLVRDNHLNKLSRWKGMDWEVKNLFEIKNGRRIVVENNLMTNNWAMGQDGTAILFSTRADNGAETIIDDIAFVGNIIRASDNGISVFGGEGGGGHNLRIRNNLFDQIGTAGGEGSGFFMRTNDWNRLVIENNTIINLGDISKADIATVRGFEFRNNIISEGNYGFKGNSTASGQDTIDRWFSGGPVTNNLIVGGRPDRYKQNNLYISSMENIGFEDSNAGDYRIRKTSRFYGKGIGITLDPKTVGHK